MEFLYALISVAGIVLINIDDSAALLSPKVTFSASLIATQQELNIQDTYFFLTPQLNVDCSCNCTKNNAQTNHVKRDKNQSCSIAYQHPNSDSDLCGPNCRIGVTANGNTKLMTAIKLSHNPKTITNHIEFQINSQVYTLVVPQGIDKLIINNDTLVYIKQEYFICDALNGYDWFYGDDRLKNLRTTDSINEANEFDLNKLGWFKKRATTTQTAFTCSTPQILNNFQLLNHNCRNSTFLHRLDASHYYKRNGLLQSEIVSQSIQQLSRVPIDDVDVDQRRKIVTITYKKRSPKLIRMSILDWKDGIKFAASISIDRFANRLLVLNLMETIIDQVIVEIHAVPGTLIHTMAIHHDGQQKEYSRRLSAKIVGDQWLCVYPLKNVSRQTCRTAVFNSHEFPNPILNTKQTRLESNSERMSRNGEETTRTNSANFPSTNVVVFLASLCSLRVLENLI